MMKGMWVAMLGLFSATVLILSAATGGEAPKHTIKQVMKEVAGAKGLCSKCGDGSITAEERERLVVLMEALNSNKPPKGDAASWKEKTTALVSAARAAKNDESKSKEFAKMFGNCKGCHSEHKGK